MIKLKELRIRNNFTQEYVANQLGITQQQYSKYERGSDYLDVKKIAILCNLYDITANDLLDVKKIYNEVMSKLDK